MTSSVVSFVFSFHEALDASEVSKVLHTYKQVLGDGLRPVKESTMIMRLIVDLGMASKLEKIGQEIAVISPGSPSFLYIYMDPSPHEICHFKESAWGKTVSGSPADTLFRTVARHRGKWEAIERTERSSQIIGVLLELARAYGVPVSDLCLEGTKDGDSTGDRTLASHCAGQWHRPLPQAVWREEQAVAHTLPRDVEKNVLRYAKENTEATLVEGLLTLRRVADASPRRAAELGGRLVQALGAVHDPSNLLFKFTTPHACEEFGKAVREADSEVAAAIFDLHYAQWFWEQGDYKQAAKLLGEVAEAADKSGDSEIGAWARYRKALAWVMEGYLEDAIHIARSAWDTAAALNDKDLRRMLDGLFERLSRIGIPMPARQLSVSLRVSTFKTFSAHDQYSFVVTAPGGLGPVEAAMMVKVLMAVECEVEVEKEGTTVSGKSIMGLMTLVASRGSTLKIRFSEVQEPFVLDAIIKAGIIVPEGTSAHYVCIKCGREVCVPTDQIKQKTACSSCGEPYLLALDNYDVRIEPE